MKHFLICDDHDLMREALSAMVGAEWPDSHINQARDFPQAWQAARSQQDICLIDLTMPGATPLDGIRTLRTHAPTTPVLVITGKHDDAEMMALLDMGIAGFVTKCTNSNIILDAIRLVLDGGSYLPPRLLELLLASRRTGAAKVDASTPQTLLTKRQISVLNLLAEGKSNKQIGRELAIAASTVKTHLEQIMRALCADNRTAVIRKATDLKLLA